MTVGYCHCKGMEMTADPRSILISMPHNCRSLLFPF